MYCFFYLFSVSLLMKRKLNLNDNHMNYKIHFYVQCKTTVVSQVAFSTDLKVTDSSPIDCDL